MFSNAKRKLLLPEIKMFFRTIWFYLQIYKNNSFINKIVTLEFSQINKKTKTTMHKNKINLVFTRMFDFLVSNQLQCKPYSNHVGFYYISFAKWYIFGNVFR